MYLKNKRNKIDTCSVESINNIKSSVSPVLAHIFNLYFSTGCFTNSPKKFRVVPTYKSGSKSNVSNFKPISICSVQTISVSGKMFQLLKHSLTRYNILATISTVVIPLYQYSQNLPKLLTQQVTKILFKKMSLYVVRGGALDWFRSQLTQREQHVSLNCINSGHRLIEYGVP